MTNIFLTGSIGGMAKIVIDAREYTSTTGRYMFRLLQYLDGLQSEHDFVLLLKPHDMDVYKYSNPRFSKVACPHKEFTLDEQFGLKKQIKNLKPDLVHFGMVQQPVWYRGKTVTTMNDLTTIRFDNPIKNPLIFKFKQQVYKWVNKRVARKATALITYSQFVKDDVVGYAGISDDKISVINLAADKISDQAEPISQLVHKQFVMYLGRPMPHKNLGRLIDAFELLRAQHPDTWLVLAGKKDANYQRIEADVQARGIKNVYFTDFVSEGQLRWLYENCAVYAFPSLSEGFGLPGLEAMLHGAPVVSSNATCLPEIYGDAAHYFDPLDVQSMADAINEVLTDKNLRQKLITAGAAQAKKYSWQRMAEQTLDAYNRSLA
jgi:glycosyltransferase involved in cell wall biosynthesis